MRDLLDKLDYILKEANLGSSEIPANKASNFVDTATGKKLSRPELFLYKVKNQSPFTKLDGTPVVINPKETAKVQAWITGGLAGPIALETMDGEIVKNTQLLKTVEFGSKEAETIKLKGSDVFDTTDQEIQDFGNSIDDLLKSGGFPASEMYEKISSSPAIKKLGKLGDAVIYMARQAADGQIPKFPDNLSNAEKKAIELYASEYLGVLGLISRIVPFKGGTRQQFDEFMGTDLSDMIMYFPKSVSNPLADSFSVVNDDTGHALKISSKAAGKGAPPSLNSLKLTDEIRDEFPEVVDFFDSATNSTLSAYTQPFAMMNWLYSNAPGTVPSDYASLLPFSKDLMSQLETAQKKGSRVDPKIMDVFYKRLSPKVAQGDSSDAGKAWYAVIKDVMHAVNDMDAIPDFQRAIIRSLGFNFIQLYSNLRGDSLVSEAFWPATIKGKVRLKTKGSSKEPTKGKISVEISPSKDDIPNEPSAVAAPSDDQDEPELTAPKRSRIKAADTTTGDEKSLGRKRRK